MKTSPRVFNLNEKLGEQPRYLNLGQIRSALLARELSCTSLFEDLFDQIELVEKDVRAWEHLDRPQTMTQAAALDKKMAAGAEVGKLFGAPIAVKDVFNTIDMPTGMGSSLWAGFTPGNDARTVYNLKSQDALVMGKTVTAEFAVHYLPASKTKNPHDFSRLPGTSSTGSAAAVASFMAPAALGTQTAGSIIRPASFCGVMGFKPTFGTVPRTGVLKTTDTLDTIGCFSRNVSDLREVFEVIRVHGRDYPLVHEKLMRVSADNFAKPRVAFVAQSLDVFGGYPGYSTTTFANFSSEIRKSLPSFSFSDLLLPAEANEIHALHETIYDKALSYYFKQESKQFEYISPMIQGMIDRGNRIDFSTWQYALGRQAELRNQITETFSEVDCVLTLSTAGEAPLLGNTELPDTCLIWNFLGFPALSLPLFKGPNGAPYGLQIVGKRYDDYKVLWVAEKILQSMGYLERA